ncbi:MAG: FKBP-type peptidyl-prolyl cis-trans isomerase [Polyangiales bacterium]
MITHAGGLATIPAPSDVAQAPADADQTPSGLRTKILRHGLGADHPQPDSHVTVHYSGWTIDGVMFDSSVVRAEPAKFPVSALIPGFTEGLQLMVVGEQRRLWIPAMLAYGTKPGRPHGTLVFDIELVSIDPP